MFIPQGFHEAEISPDEHDVVCRLGEMLPLQDEYNQLAVVCFQCNRAWDTGLNRKLVAMNDSDFVLMTRQMWHKAHQAASTPTFAEATCEHCGGGGMLARTVDGLLCMACRKQALAARQQERITR